MNRARLHRLIEALGAEPARWPARERAAAEKLLAETPGIAVTRHEAAALDRLLARDHMVPRLGAKDRVMAALTHLPMQEGGHSRWLSRGGARSVGGEPLFAWPQLATFAAAAALGLVIGASDIVNLAAPATATDPVALAFDVSPGMEIEQ